MLVELTRDDYLKFSGIDLEIELKGGNYDQVQHLPELMIQRVHDQLVGYMRSHFHFDGVLKSNQTDGFKTALLWQIDYIRRNGELSLDCENTCEVLCRDAYNSLYGVGLANASGFYSIGVR